MLLSSKGAASRKPLVVRHYKRNCLIAWCLPFRSPHPSASLASSPERQIIRLPSIESLLQGPPQSPCETCNLKRSFVPTGQPGVRRSAIPSGRFLEGRIAAAWLWHHKRFRGRALLSNSGDHPIADETILTGYSDIAYGFTVRQAKSANITRAHKSWTFLVRVSGGSPRGHGFPLQADHIATGSNPARPGLPKRLHRSQAPPRSVRS